MPKSCKAAMELMQGMFGSQERHKPIGAYMYALANGRVRLSESHLGLHFPARKSVDMQCMRVTRITGMAPSL